MESLSVNDTINEKVRRIIVPVDNHHNWLDAIHWYFEDMKKANDLLLFVHVINPAQKRRALNYPLLIGTVGRILNKHVVAGKALCREAMQMAANNCVKAHSYLYVDTKPWTAIVRAANELDGDIFLMGAQKCSACRSAVSDSCGDCSPLTEHRHNSVVLELKKPITVSS
ncbi:Universal stress protein [Paragonimus heterotremus]|uniref:Universal stress protein n=1 Tax=Paragonimus heterotremus TaxID=100268 RepID=A0A8J4SQR4_9TREM|nr:Universal stress protein [Paragonimus heterotremus]